MFEPFYTRFDGGRGLGMAVVRQILDSYAGKIEVQSEPRVGTDVLIIAALPGDVPARRSGNGGRAPMNTVLIVDDERSIVELLTVVLKKEGYAVLANPGAPSVYEDIEQKDIDLLICDIKMPQIDGMDVLRHLKKAKPTVPAIMITAYASVKQAVEALRLGALDYLTKPFDIEELKVLVANGLEHRRLLEENRLLKQTFRDEASFENMIGKSRAMREVYGSDREGGFHGFHRPDHGGKRDRKGTGRPGDPCQ